MPKFCRHNRLLQNCPICSREQDVELRPVLSSSAPRVAEPRERAPRPAATRDGSRRVPSGGGLIVRHARNRVDDGYRSPLVPGLKSTEEAAHLADEVALAAERLRRLAEDPPGLYAEVADAALDLEERSWLAFLIAYLYPLDDGDAFSPIATVRTSWTSGQEPLLDDVVTGPRTAHDPARGTRTLEAYRAWAERAGTQAAAFVGDGGWSPERRFDRVFERLALPGMNRDARFELLVSLGTLGAYELRAGTLKLGGSDQVSVAAKRALAIGDPLLLERRAAQLAEACSVPLAALDLALYNWETGRRTTGGLGEEAQADEARVASVHAALGL
jgi:hypothetical protein